MAFDDKLISYKQNKLKHFVFDFFLSVRLQWGSADSLKGIIIIS